MKEIGINYVIYMDRFLMVYFTMSFTFLFRFKKEKDEIESKQVLCSMIFNLHINMQESHYIYIYIRYESYF